MVFLHPKKIQRGRPAHVSPPAGGELEGCALNGITLHFAFQAANTPLAPLKRGRSNGRNLLDSYPSPGWELRSPTTFNHALVKRQEAKTRLAFCRKILNKFSYLSSLRTRADRVLVLASRNKSCNGKRVTFLCVYPWETEMPLQ